MVRSIDDLTLHGRRVLVRVDFNVPLNADGVITDDKRIVESLPTIRKIVDSGGSAILMSHLGRPKGGPNPKYSLMPVATHLAALLGQPVPLATDCVGPEVEALVSSMADGDVLLLENLRFHAEEEANDPGFARQLAGLADVYVNDAFGTAHRAHASTEGVTRFVSERGAGYLLLKELKFLGDAVRHPQHPFIAILGGAKISGKIDVIKNLMGFCDTILIGGGMSFTFFKAQGLQIGASLLEEDRLQMAHDLLDQARQRNVDLVLPVDVVVADRMAADAATKIVSIDAIPPDWMGLDIGPATIEMFRGRIGPAKTVVWNGPMGVFEMPAFANGTRSVAEALAAATDGGATTIVGGGDSAAAISDMNLDDRVTHVSTGGGASLEFLEGKILPGVAALEG